MLLSTSKADWKKVTFCDCNYEVATVLFGITSYDTYYTKLGCILHKLCTMCITQNYNAYYPTIQTFFMKFPIQFTSCIATVWQKVTIDTYVGAGCEA